jgi:hypothetical protein
MVSDAEQLAGGYWTKAGNVMEMHEQAGEFKECS